VKSSIIDTDFFAFQETEVTINAEFGKSFGSGYSLFHVFHDEQYWSDYRIPSIPFNKNGVSVAVNTARYDEIKFSDEALGTAGCHAAMVTCRHKTLNRRFRFACIHIDTGMGKDKHRESDSIMTWFEKQKKEGDNAIEIIAGDFNGDPSKGVLRSRIGNSGFKDILSEIGQTGNTSPYSSSYNKNSMFGFIDHVLVRAGKLSDFGGKVHSNGLFELGSYPVINGKPGEKNEEKRITRNMEITGTDHFPIEVDFVANV
jgi:endonuclease/exonuclease/phosphatase family metal-dependent hydrolase